MSPFQSLKQKAYGCVCADPPWYFRTRTAEVSDRDPRNHYPVMSLQDIIDLPVAEIVLPDAHLFMWVTGPFLDRAFDVMKAWGFRYSGVAFTWVKLKRAHDPRQLRVLSTAEADLHLGLGYTTRKNAELCLLGRRGSPKRMDSNVREIILAPVREHSRKPDQFRQRVSSYVGADCKVVELFARETHPGWDAWGNEVGKFDGRKQAA